MQDGVSCWQEKRPIEKVGLYIPGGTAPLFSSVLMLAIPATIAGCREIVLCTPPNQSGQLAPAIRYAAYKCGVTRFISSRRDPSHWRNDLLVRNDSQSL